MTCHVTRHVANKNLQIRVCRERRETAEVWRKSKWRCGAELASTPASQPSSYLTPLPAIVKKAMNQEATSAPNPSGRLLLTSSIIDPGCIDMGCGYGRVLTQSQRQDKVVRVSKECAADTHRKCKRRVAED